MRKYKLRFYKRTEDTSIPYIVQDWGSVYLNSRNTSDAIMEAQEDFNMRTIIRPSVKAQLPFDIVLVSQTGNRTDILRDGVFLDIPQPKKIGAITLERSLSLLD